MNSLNKISQTIIKAFVEFRKKILDVTLKDGVIVV